MAAQLTCTIVSPEETLYDGDASHVVAPGVRGEIGVYPRHAPLIARLMPGVLRVHVPMGDLVLKFATRGGFLEVAHDHVTVLVTKAVGPRYVDKPAVEDELADVISQLKNPSTDEHFGELLERRRWLETCLAVWEERRLIDTRGM
jgi:F-type H+-transporting ATPase subunit epsilon